VNRPAPTLFDAAKLAEQRCPACGAIRFPQQPRAVTCSHDLDPERGRRPHGCLNATDPATAPFPEGF
jgi:hypothetical protein